MSLSITTTYAGEVLEAFLTKAATGNDSVDKGCVKVKSGIQSRYTLPTLKLDGIIQDRVATPSSSKGTFTIGERELNPQDFMVYTEFNPRDLESFWKFAQPEGNLVFRKLDSQVQVALVGELLKGVNEYMGYALWHGVKNVTGTFSGTPTGGIDLGSGDYDQFDGFLPRILEAGRDLPADDQPILSGSTEITNDTEILAALNGVFDKIPKAIRSKSGLKIMMDIATFDKYDQALLNNDFKNADYTSTNAMRFRGIEIVPCNGVPASTIVAGVFNTANESNLWMGVDYSNDENVIQIDKLQNNSELYFFKMLMKADTTIAIPSQLVYHTPYTFGV